MSDIFDDEDEPRGDAPFEMAIQAINAQILREMRDPADEIEETPDMEFALDMIPEGEPQSEEERSAVNKTKKELFLMALAQCGQVKKAAAYAGIKSMMELAEWKRNDKEFKKAWEMVDDIAGDLFESEAIRRAVQGTLKPVYHKGMLVGHERQFSDTLLTKLLEARKPEKFRPKQQVSHEHKGNVGVAVIPSERGTTFEQWEADVKTIHANQTHLLESSIQQESEEFAQETKADEEKEANQLRRG